MLTTTKILKLTTAFEEIYMTLFDRDLLINGQIYRSDLLTDEIMIEYSASIQADEAYIQIVRDHINYLEGILQIHDYDLITQQIIQPANFVGKIIDIVGYDSVISLQAYSSKRDYDQYILRNYDTACDAIWGDHRCTVPRENYRQTIQIIDMFHDTEIFYALLEGENIAQFHAPYLEDAMGNQIPIMRHDPIMQSFYCEPHYAFRIGQTYNLYTGCQKTPENCQKYGNFDNYLGFI